MTRAFDVKITLERHKFSLNEALEYAGLHYVYTCKWRSKRRIIRLNKATHLEQNDQDSKGKNHFLSVCLGFKGFFYQAHNLSWGVFIWPSTRRLPFYTQNKSWTKCSAALLVPTSSPLLLKVAPFVTWSWHSSQLDWSLQRERNNCPYRSPSRLTEPAPQIQCMTWKEHICQVLVTGWGSGAERQAGRNMKNKKNAL